MVASRERAAAVRRWKWTRKTDSRGDGAALPLTNQVRKVWAHNMGPAALRAADFEPVAELADADVAIIRTITPWQDQHPNYQIKGIYHEGDLD